MTVTTVDINTPQEKGEVAPLPVAALETILLGTLVCTGADGYLVDGEDDADLQFEGVSAEGVDNSEGADGDLDCKVYKTFVHEFACSGLAETDVGCDLYMLDNRTVTKTPTSQYVGKLDHYESATVAPLDIRPALRMAADHANQGGIQDLPLAATESIDDGDLVVFNPAGYLAQGANTRGYRFGGIAREDADNSAGADGAIDCQVDQAELQQLTCSGLTQEDEGKPVWLATATTITTTPGNVFVGIIRKVVSATVAEVDISVAISGKKHPNILDFGVAEAKSVTAGYIGATDADGYLVEADDSDAIVVQGIILETEDNSLGVDGDLTVRVFRGGIWEFTAAGLAAADGGKPVFVGSDAKTVTTTPGNLYVGILPRYTSATKAQVAVTEEGYLGSGRLFTIPFLYNGAVGAVGVKAHPEDMEFERKYLPLRGFAGCDVAPGGAYFCTIELDDGTTQYAIVITGSATKGENKTPGTTPMKAGTDTDVTLVDDHASGATDTVFGWILCREL